MQRYAQGLKVPKQYMDRFSGLSTDASALIAVGLTYTPKSVNHIQFQIGRDASMVLMMYVAGLIGKQLTIQVKKIVYSKADSPTSSVDGETGGVGGASPHSHVITDTLTNVGDSSVITWAIPDFLVHYEVA